MLYVLLAACGEGAMILLLLMMFLPGISLGNWLTPYIGVDWAGVAVMVFDLLLIACIIWLGRSLFRHLVRKDMTAEQRQEADRAAAARHRYGNKSRKRHSEWRKESRQKKRDFKKWQAENRRTQKSRASS